jgi:hypothetical protein
VKESGIPETTVVREHVQAVKWLHETVAGRVNARRCNRWLSPQMTTLLTERLHESCNRWLSPQMTSSHGTVARVVQP